MMTTSLLAPLLSRKSLQNTYEYAGGTISILLAGAETGGQFSIWEGLLRPGSEPPLHVHHTMDETFVVLEGEMRFMAGDQIVYAPAGSVVFAPRGVPHTFKIKSAASRSLTICTPAGFEEWFSALGVPATSFELPAPAQPPSQAEMQKMMELGRRLRTELLRPVEF